MAKGDDIKMKKKNKANRRKLQKDPSSVSARVAALIAAKKRRQSGKRRNCQGMCFSLPTQEDPFNERHGKGDISMSKIKKPPQSNNKVSLKHVVDKQQKRMLCGDKGNLGNKKARRLVQLELENQQKISVGGIEEENNVKLKKGNFHSLGNGVLVGDLGDQNSVHSGCPSKFLCMCLNSIRDSLLGDGELNKEQEEPLFVNSWGVEFWKAYSLGNDILENSGTSPSVQQIAWIASTAVDSISREDKEEILFASPFLLYLVPSQEKAIKVRSVCKPLKAFGIHTVSVHPGTSLEHQVHGLKSCAPEFLIATPERLLELAFLKAVDISGVSLLVVDGMDSLSNCLDAIKCIKDSICGNPCTVVFKGFCSAFSTQDVQSILGERFHTLSLHGSINNQDFQSNHLDLEVFDEENLRKL